jgi:hypothetical protein
VGILQDAKAFEGKGISPLGLFLGALFSAVLLYFIRLPKTATRKVMIQP